MRAPACSMATIARRLTSSTCAFAPSKLSTTAMVVPERVLPFTAAASGAAGLGTPTVAASCLSSP
ncbi:hypothetical protein D3C87_1614020 [compost metagenome]